MRLPTFTLPATAATRGSAKCRTRQPTAAGRHRRVGVEGHQDLAARGGDRPVQRRGLAGVGLPQQPDARVARERGRRPRPTVPSVEPSSTTTHLEVGVVAGQHRLRTVRAMTGSSLKAAISTDTEGRKAGSKTRRRARRCAATASGTMSATRPMREADGEQEADGQQRLEDEHGVEGDPVEADDEQVARRHRRHHRVARRADQLRDGHEPVPLPLEQRDRHAAAPPPCASGRRRRCAGG